VYLVGVLGNAWLNESSLLQAFVHELWAIDS